MAVIKKEDYLTRLTALLGDDLDDNKLSLLEDFSDTYDSLKTEKDDDTDWKAKYEENDKAWRTKYKERFLQAPDPSTKVNPDEPDRLKDDDDPEDPPGKQKFDDLFE